MSRQAHRSISQPFNSSSRSTPLSWLTAHLPQDSELGLNLARGTILKGAAQIWRSRAARSYSSSWLVLRSAK
jgi:hypothetical protein